MTNANLVVRSTVETVATVWVRTRYVDGKELAGSTDPRSGRFRAVRPDLLPLPTVAQTYFRLGMDHVLEGVDHLLFLAGLVWLLGSAKDVLLTVTTFTLGHALALLLAATGWFHLEPTIVEVLIGGSIVFVGRELWHQAVSTAQSMTRFFGLPFGLLHGLGFAGALQDLGLSSLAAIAFFNCGVELGQLLWVLGLSALSLLVQRRRASYRAVARFAASGIGIAGAWITLERIIRVVFPASGLP